MRKLSGYMLGIVCSLLFVVGGSDAQAQSAPTVIREGIQIGALGALRTTLPIVASKEGLKFEIKNFSDSSATLRALAQGDLDIANTTSQHMIRAITEGLDVVWVMGWGGGYNVLVARKGFAVPANDSVALKSIVDRRKETSPVTIAVPTGSLQNAKLITYLRNVHIDPDRDVKIINVGFADQPRALEAGQVDMAMTLAPFGSLAIEKNGATLVKHLYGGAYGKQEVGFIVQRKLIESNPALVQRIINAHVDAMKLFVGNKDEQVKYEMMYSRFPESVVNMTERQFLTYDWRTNVVDLKLMAHEMKQLGWAKEDVSAQIGKSLDLTFLSKATGQSVDALSHW
ncbi:MAG: ABC transporter substrate-binding protein [Burkholderiaceae bacterium]|uniref:ABC transporter substrate-binding protein n=1 Tax=Pandoraea sp. TaxID=1883445 RepID=UPI001211F934|nr:ABC transporter substrate-binding protein [Pandoraea sp.]TAL80114.1 MAG: ABC transporter substrate-binding protein [Burkholderiaceae bacterium]TAM13979.1 MAG: ABC transporter substrate-binding protein [Pandoraea sp.]